MQEGIERVVKNSKLILLNQPYDEVLLIRDRQYKHYKANEDRIILSDGLLFRKIYGKKGTLKNYQVHIPKQFVDDVLRKVHGEFGRHPEITKTRNAYGEKYYYPERNI